MKNKKINIYIVGTQKGYFAAFDTDLFELVDELKDANILLFTGGEDVTPSFYGETAHPSTYNNENRDKMEQSFFRYAQAHKRMCLGICRGSQFLTAMSGGKLIQHCDNHAIGGTHQMTVLGGSIIPVTSTHHQMMHPFDLPEDDYTLLGWSTESRSSVRWLNEKVECNKLLEEPEVVYYHNTKCLAVQGHPEFDTAPNLFVTYFNELVLEYYEQSY